MPISSNTYPVNLILEAKPCLVVGGGTVAARKAQGLLACGARVHLVAAEVGNDVRRLAGEPPGALTWEERAYDPCDVTGRCLVIAATDDQGLNRLVAADAQAGGVWVNVADDPVACTFTLPAVRREGPVTVAVSTGGHSPALAVWLRDHLSAGLGPECTPIGPEHAQAALLLAEAREELRSAGRSTEGLDWQGALDSDMFTSIRAGRIDEAREQLRACLSLS